MDDPQNDVLAEYCRYSSAWWRRVEWEVALCFASETSMYNAKECVFVCEQYNRVQLKLTKGPHIIILEICVAAEYTQRYV